MLGNCFWVRGTSDFEWPSNALTKKGSEVSYSWGIGNHGQKQGGAIFPEMMRWLWREQPVSTDPNDMVERSFRHPPAQTADTAPATSPAKELKN